ncbi:hypothetical protein H257_05357 [Aphanomyces astaci]|uniref:Thioredoxin domain-containing protein n=1 Tax=Aphanomyces astaci TaxID=112090 RepID=W4GS91_APHAT|nr:hypothetical protein H257_05357 [Aphanomyces astaci]ETV81768.1 hypothetical protein H257_05357 [Aphanomyces astaci]RQM21809.1 hypothetical protein B5M09_010593 [Aphanomyces astaci]|eukprot:XP_009828505.1 hypothetical protein H257_05357 [Aphanomyces astaci]
MRSSLVGLQVLVALALLSSLYFVSEISSSLHHDSTISMLNTLRFRRSKFHQPNKHDALDYTEAKDVLYNTTSGDPYFVLVVSGKLASGEYWCSDCEQARKPLDRAFASTGARHLVVSVGSREDWVNASNPFRVGPLFRVDEIPALLRYDGDLHTTTLLTGGAFLSDEAMLHAILTPPRASPPTVLHLSTVQGLAMYFDTYAAAKSTYPLYVYFVSGTNPDGKLWCPFCAEAELPVMTYFEQFASDDAVLLRVVTASSLEDWHRDDNPFNMQTIITISGLPMLIRAKPESFRQDSSAALEFQEYTAIYEETALLKAFYQGEIYAEST